MRPSRPRRDVGAAVLLGTALALVLASCHDLPPRVPTGYVGSQPPGAAWPAPPAYHPDPIHPLNRWFQRAFGPRDHGGEIALVVPTRPLPGNLEPDAVDRAESLALLASALREEGLSAGSIPAYRDPISAAILVSDLLQVALSQAAREPPAEDAARLVEALVDLARRVAERHPPREDVLAAIAEPPPLRSGSWLELPPPETPGLAPAAGDLRWTRIACADSQSDGTSSIVLLRLRVAVGARREVVLLPIANECWEVVIAGDEIADDAAESARTRLWRFDRGLWTLGKDPWVLTQGEEGLAGEQLEILAAGVVPSAQALAPAAFLDSAEGGHDGEGAKADVPVQPFAAILGAAWKAGQRDRIARILDEVLWPRVGNEGFDS